MMTGDLKLDEPYVGLKFESEEEAKDFYVEYSKRLGFVVRMMQRRRSGIDGRTLARRLGCNKQGFGPNNQRSSSSSSSSREGCKATILVKMEKSGKWVVTRFIKEHNHSLQFIGSSSYDSFVRFQSLYLWVFLICFAITWLGCLKKTDLCYCFLHLWFLFATTRLDVLKKECASLGLFYLLLHDLVGWWREICVIVFCIFESSNFDSLGLVLLLQDFGGWKREIFVTVFLQLCLLFCYCKIWLLDLPLQTLEIPLYVFIYCIFGSSWFAITKTWLLEESEVYVTFFFFFLHLWVLICYYKTWLLDFPLYVFQVCIFLVFLLWYYKNWMIDAERFVLLFL